MCDNVLYMFLSIDKKTQRCVLKQRQVVIENQERVLIPKTRPHGLMSYDKFCYLYSEQLYKIYIDVIKYINDINIQDAAIHYNRDEIMKSLFHALYETSTNAFASNKQIQNL